MENTPVVWSLDIIERAGGKHIPYAEVVEFTLKNDVVKNRLTDEVIIEYDSTDFKRNVKFTFSKVIGMPKLDSFILYYGTLSGKKYFYKKLFLCNLKN
jgi:hypothetical protein